MKSIGRPLVLLLASASALSAGAPIDSPIMTSAPTTSEDWWFRGAMYGWAQGLDGDVGIRGLTADLNVDFKDILEDLDIAAMGVFEIGRGRWSVLADFNYAEIGDGVSPIPAAPGLVIDYDQKQFLGNFFLIYQLMNEDSLKLDVFGGARVNWIDVELDTVGPGISRDEAWVDPVIGARFQAALPHDFFFRALGDIGGFGAASDLTWQALAGFGWRFSECGSVLLGYRAIGTDYQNGGFSYDVTTHGPVLGVEFKF